MEDKVTQKIFESLIQLNQRISGIEKTIKQPEPVKEPELQELYPQSSKETGELVKALCKAQAEFKKVEASGHSHFGVYATLEDMMEATLSALQKYELHLSQEPFTNQYGITFIYSKLRHGPSDQWTSCRVIVIQEQPNDCKKLGSGITYSKRFSWSSILGLKCKEIDSDTKKVK